MKSFINSIPEAMAETNLVCSSVNVASTKAGVNLDAIGLMGRIIKQTAERPRTTIPWAAQAGRFCQRGRR